MAILHFKSRPTRRGGGDVSPKVPRALREVRVIALPLAPRLDRDRPARGRARRAAEDEEGEVEGGQPPRRSGGLIVAAEAAVQVLRQLDF